MSEQEQISVSLGGGPCVHLTKQECWELYVLLADEAPFVRHQLTVLRHGGTSGLSLTTPAERQQVLDRLVADREDGEQALGLSLLKAALEGIRPSRCANEAKADGGALRMSA